MYSDFDREVGEQRVEQEKAARIAEAGRQVGRRGRAFCDCGNTISDYRRDNFGAVRCIDCQNQYEREASLK